MASLRNLAIGVHRQDGATNIAAAVRRTARDQFEELTRRYLDLRLQTRDAMRSDLWSDNA